MFQVMKSKSEDKSKNVKQLNLVFTPPEALGSANVCLLGSSAPAAVCQLILIRLLIQNTGVCPLAPVCQSNSLHVNQ